MAKSDDERKAAWMPVGVWVRWNIQKHRYRCESLGSILAIAVETFEKSPRKEK